MMKILFATFFAVFVIGQAVSGDFIKVHQYEEAIPDGLPEVAADAFKKLQDLIMGAINSAIKSLEGLKTDLQSKFNDMKQKIVDEAKAQFDKIINGFMAEINTWKQRAEKLGIDVKDCYVENEKLILGLPQRALEKMLSCITNEYNTVMKLINETETLIKDTFNQVVEVGKKLTSCNWWDLVCYGDVVVKCSSLSINLVTQITTKVTEVTTFVTGIQTRLQVCAATQVTNITLDAGNIAKTIIECIQKKITTKALLM